MNFVHVRSTLNNDALIGGLNFQLILKISVFSIDLRTSIEKTG